MYIADKQFLGLENKITDIALLYEIREQALMACNIGLNVYLS